MDTNKIVSYFRNKGNFSCINCITNIKNEQWLFENFKLLSIGDHSLVAEYGPKRFRNISLEHLRSIYLNES